MALPVYSNYAARAAAHPDSRDQRQDDVLGAYARRQRAIHPHLEGLGLALQQALAGQDVLHLAGADAERQRAERAVRGGVAVPAHHRHAGLREAQLRADHVHDALAVAVDAQAPDAEIGAVGFELRELPGCNFIDDRQRAIGGRDAVIGGGDGEVGTPHLEAARPKAVEGLRRRDFVHQVQVDKNQRGCAGLLLDDMRIPEFFDDGLGHNKSNSIRPGIPGPVQLHYG